MGMSGPGGGGEPAPELEVGGIRGFIPKYNTTTAITLTAGKAEANGKIFDLSSDVSHAMTSLLSAYGLHYIYIDDSASTEPTAVFIDSLTAPSWDVAKCGWYNGDDRCIGVVPSPLSVIGVTYFSTEVMSDKTIRVAW